MCQEDDRKNNLHFGTFQFSCSAPKLKRALFYFRNIIFHLIFINSHFKFVLLIVSWILLDISVQCKVCTVLYTAGEQYLNCTVCWKCSVIYIIAVKFAGDTRRLKSERFPSLHFPTDICPSLPLPLPIYPPIRLAELGRLSRYN